MGDAGDPAQCARGTTLSVRGPTPSELKGGARGTGEAPGQRVHHEDCSNPS